MKNPMHDLVKRAAGDLVASSYAVVLTGAGISTESGVSDFRGPKGVYKINRDAETQAYQRFDRFLSDPVAYWQEMLGTVGAGSSFYNQMLTVSPNPGHYALAKLEQMGIIKSVVTQNVDGLHEKAGSRTVLHYHGTVEKLRCLYCGARFGLDRIVLDKLPPLCDCGRALKYDVVHYNEPIPPDMTRTADEQVAKCDVMLVCGTSAVVYPFAALPSMAKGRGKSRVKIIEINAEPTPLTYQGISDYLIEGKTGEILPIVVDEVNKLLGRTRDDE